MGFSSFPSEKETINIPLLKGEKGGSLVELSSLGIPLLTSFAVPLSKEVLFSLNSSLFNRFACSLDCFAHNDTHSELLIVNYSLFLVNCQLFNRHLRTHNLTNLLSNLRLPGFIVKKVKLIKHFYRIIFRILHRQHSRCMLRSFIIEDC